MARDAEAGWFGALQVQWLDRVQRDPSNLREALDFSIFEGGHDALDFAADLYQFWFLRGPFNESAPVARPRAEPQGRALVQKTADPIASAAVAIGDGFAALATGQVDHASACLQDAIDVRISPTMRGGALVVLGWAQELRGGSVASMASYEAVLALSESHGEFMNRMLALLSMGACRTTVS